MAKLKRLLEVELRNLRAVRSAHAKDLESRTELEALLRACVQDVKHEIGLCSGRRRRAWWRAAAARARRARWASASSARRSASA